MIHAKIGHVHLQVRDLERSIAFYTRVFGLRVVEQIGNHYAFLTGGEMHHEVALRAVGPHAPGPLTDGVGLYHAAFEVEDKSAFAEAYEVLTTEGLKVYPIDHVISWAMYFSDPDGNGLEIYTDTRQARDGRESWHGENRHLTRETILAARQASEAI